MATEHTGEYGLAQVEGDAAPGSAELDVGL